VESIKRKQLKEKIIDVLFPRICVGCGKEGGYICNDCRLFISESGLICPVCQKASFDGEKHVLCPGKNQLDGLINIWDYEGIVKKLLLKIKYKGTFHAIEELIEKSFEIREPFVPAETIITFVPMFKKKEKQRGFNQAKFIAQKAGERTQKEVLPLLEKTKDTPSQTELDIKERLENVKGTFGLSKRFFSSALPENILLVDDIWTTGATMKECCKVLKESGRVKKIWGFTLARTV
jgi:competence protein ComFC